MKYFTNECDVCFIVFFFFSVVRLVRSLSSGSGRVEFFNKGTWNEICPYMWDDNAARVFCHQLGFNNGKRKSSGNSTREIPRKIIGCLGNESSLFECAHVISNISISNYMCTRHYAMANCYQGLFYFIVLFIIN